jgi:hypothetical protein
MHLQLKINSSTPFSLSVGDGSQSLKWLSMVASQQYALRKPAGRSRAREGRDDKGSPGFYIPESMSSSKGQAFDNPNLKISDVFQDGATCCIALSTVLEVDEIGAPVLTQWQSKAFFNGEAGKMRALGGAEREKAERRRAKEVQDRVMTMENRKRFEMQVNVSGAIEGMQVSISLGLVGLLSLFLSLSFGFSHCIILNTTQ